MARISPAVASKRATIAGLSVGVKTGKRQPDDPELKAAYRDLAVERLAEHAERVIAGWPKPTPEQLQRIAALLLAGGPADAAADQPVVKKQSRGRARRTDRDVA